MKQYIKIVNGRVAFYNDPLVIGDKQVFNPSEEQILAEGWVEYIPEEEPIVEYQLTYEEKVVELIRQRYTIDDEIAILRQKETKPDEFQAWYDYCEACKAEARNSINNE